MSSLKDNFIRKLQIFVLTVSMNGWSSENHHRNYPSFTKRLEWAQSRKYWSLMTWGLAGTYNEASWGGSFVWRVINQWSVPFPLLPPVDNSLIILQLQSITWQANIPQSDTVFGFVCACLYGQQIAAHFFCSPLLTIKRQTNHLYAQECDI